MTGKEAKEIANLTQLLHNQCGACAINLTTGTSVLSEDGQTVGNPLQNFWRFESELITAKQVKTYLWANKEHPQLKLPNVALWTVLEDGCTLLGLGEVVPVEQEVLEEAA